MLQRSTTVFVCKMLCGATAPGSFASTVVGSSSSSVKSITSLFDGCLKNGGASACETATTGVVVVVVVATTADVAGANRAAEREGHAGGAANGSDCNVAATAAAVAGLSAAVGTLRGWIVLALFIAAKWAEIL